MYVYSEVPSHVGGNGGNVMFVATFSHIASTSAPFRKSSHMYEVTHEKW